MADVSKQVRVLKTPDYLYDLCLKKFVNCLYSSTFDINVLHSMPDRILIDAYYKMVQEKKLSILSKELSELERFDRPLRFAGSQVRLIQCFQAVVKVSPTIPTKLAAAYVYKCDHSRRESLIKLGLRLGSFLNEAGWYVAAQTVLLKCRDICEAQPKTLHYQTVTLDCCRRLLHAQSAYCCFPAAAETYSLALKLLGVPEKAAGNEFTKGIFSLEDPFVKLMQTQAAEDFKYSVDEGWDQCNIGRSTLAALLCSGFSTLFFKRCEYNDAYAWSMRGLALLTPSSPNRITIDVLRACGKACVVKRRYPSTKLLLQQVVILSHATYGLRHPRYAAALLDLGYYLLNIDSVPESVSVYEEALKALLNVFGDNSIIVARAQEDMAYALYVLEYSSGSFNRSFEHSQEAKNIYRNLVPPNHLLLASAKRVSALISEEIAFRPINFPPFFRYMLVDAYSQHKESLALSIINLGENNVQTAQQYGNLGRLYQTVGKYTDSEQMHMKAISIKKKLLGEEDYEVGLSIGHLASLYNYHMKRYEEAKDLYLTSISIGLKHFGERYSGLCYDYTGLKHVFEKLQQPNRVIQYDRMLKNWLQLQKDKAKTTLEPVYKMMVIDELQVMLFSPNG